PASLESFEDDYDDVSLSESGGARKAPVPKDGELESQGGTGLYTLARKPPSPPPPSSSSRKGARSKVTSVAILYILVAFSFVAWVLLFALAVVKHLELLEELKLLRSNHSENQARVWQELLDTRQEQARLRSGMHKYYEELQDITALICKSSPSRRRCSAGWKVLERSCYYFSSERMSWRDAQEICADQGAHLVVVDSEEEQ
ncbi:CL17A protein, partial [Bucco capensis]|nr:CL17A protein [Bucco capensis]